MKIPLAIQEIRKEACQACDQHVEIGEHGTRCKLRGGAKRSCPRCWARFDAVDKRTGCPRDDKGWYADAPVKQTAAPEAPALKFSLEHGTPEWLANMTACRACRYYARGVPEFCRLDNRQCSTRAMAGDCKRFPYNRWRQVGQAASAPPKFPASPPAYRVSFPIDLVYLWVDGSDPAWVASLKKHTSGVSPASSRFYSADELRYSLRSVERFAPWVRRVFIVTNGQLPQWLNRNHPKVRIVTHDQIIPAEFLPTFNSAVIECHIHRIPDLGEHFLYANDDMLFSAPVEPGHFFTSDGRALMKLVSAVRTKSRDIFGSMLDNAARILDSRFGEQGWRRGWHFIKPYRKSMMAEVADFAADWIAEGAKHRTRHTKNVAWNCGVWPAFSVAAGYAIETPNDRCLTATYIQASEALANMEVTEKPPHLLCVNNTTKHTAAQVEQLLKALLPSASSFEVALPAKPKRRVERIFNVGAKYGDLIYCLPILRAAGGGHLRYINRIGSKGYDSEVFLRMVTPLLEMQPYVASVELGLSNDGAAIDLEAWRFNGCKKGKSDNLAAHYAKHSGVAGVDFTTPWLTVDQLRRVARVVINRTAKYRNDRFPWLRVLRQYAGELVFIGTPAEHEAFVKEVGPVPFYRTKDLLEVARVIAGSELFIGNQSSAYAIAEGLKHPTVQEVCPKQPDCLFKRSNAIYAWDENDDLPVIS